MNILCATDDNYVPYCGIMLTSLFENNKDEDIHVFILTESLSLENNKKYADLAKKYRQEITIVIVNKDSFKNCPVKPGDHVSTAAYFRLMVSDLLPADIDKILYLDCDIIINGSLKGIYNSDISNQACGVIFDEAGFDIINYTRNNLDIKRHQYLNSGVLLINLDYWRKHNVSLRCMEYVDSHSDNLAFHDQDTLNAVLKDEISFLPIKYNFQTGYITKQVFNSYPEAFQKEIQDSVKSPVVIHFTGKQKPWIKGCRQPYTPIWDKYRKLSFWKDNSIIIPKMSLKTKLEVWRNELIWKLGIKKRPQTYIHTCS